ncbi:alpha/beta hydrolase [Nocardia sp. NPDC057030]|uniref:alpha/beta hydrolase n=1 Tax=unclassified Nocardia TaxID=2637762 RepID=UPI003631A99D
MSFPVAGGTLAGSLCLPAGESTTVMVLTSGSAANSVYWDFPYQPEVYSFARAMNAAGYATLALDRPGNGQSSTPPFWTVTASTDAAGVHTAVQALRHGLAGIDPFEGVVLGGNALGSGVSVLEAATYHDVDGVLLTGYSHAIDPLVALDSAKTFPHAPDDPAFQGSEPGSLTMAFGTPEAARNYFGPHDDPAVIETSE